MGILKTVGLADFAEKNAKRIRILKEGRVGRLRREKCQRIGILKNEINSKDSDNFFVTSQQNCVGFQKNIFKIQNIQEN